ERIVIFPGWQAIDRVERHALGWVLSADQLTFLVPGASFAGSEAEQAFVAALVERLPADARDRSPEAVALAGAEPAAVQVPETAAAGHAPTGLPAASARTSADELSWAG